MLETYIKIIAVNQNARRMAGVRECHSATADTLYRRVAECRSRNQFFGLKANER